MSREHLPLTQEVLAPRPSQRRFKQPFHVREAAAPSLGHESSSSSINGTLSVGAADEEENSLLQTVGREKHSRPGGCSKRNIRRCLGSSPHVPGTKWKFSHEEVGRRKGKEETEPFPCSLASQEFLPSATLSFKAHQPQPACPKLEIRAANVAETLLLWPMAGPTWASQSFGWIL